MEMSGVNVVSQQAITHSELEIVTVTLLSMKRVNEIFVLRVCGDAETNCYHGNKMVFIAYLLAYTCSSGEMSDNGHCMNDMHGDLNHLFTGYPVLWKWC